MPQRNANRLAPATTESGLDTVIRQNSDKHQPRRAALIVATSIFFMPIMASNARFASVAGRQGLRQHTRRDLL
jgi:hypothetical protein